ncbi:MAG: hypothetical protein AAGF24_09925 [Cyanobacteria bacterium P01_H01_bin.121]
MPVICPEAGAVAAKGQYRERRVVVRYALPSLPDLQVEVDLGSADNLPKILREVHQELIKFQQEISDGTQNS